MEGQPSVIISTGLEELTPPVFHVKIKAQLSGSGEIKISSFTIYKYGSHLGRWNVIMLTNVIPLDQYIIPAASEVKSFKGYDNAWQTKLDDNSTYSI